MKEGRPSAVYLKDYTPPVFLIDRVDLRFRIGEEETRVDSRLTVRRNPSATDAGTGLVLDGEQLRLGAVRLNGDLLTEDRYQVDDERLSIPGVPGQFTLEITTFVKPDQNSSLEGLYRSGGNLCTQCEAEGFRKITYFLDRPDILSVYTTTLVADAGRYPVLLANGNRVDSGPLDGGLHFVTWHDPHPKPCYLFAVVGGDLGCRKDRYTTRSGREVALEIYVERHNLDKCDHALRSLQRAMRWDEQRFGLEYDLDRYMIVAVDDFNMGAMENKGLNIFNSKYVLARPETATDTDFVNVEAVIGHEYFHNWTGNRVTCRDWFQLSLKEGLTVFREQEFTADLNSAALKRVDDVRRLRTHQFAEDASPMAHPVRPDSYIEISNFYTATVYEKGAEVVRMYQTLLGLEGFRRGMDLYFQRHDGQAVTTDDFCAAMADANGVDLGQFARWYQQVGTPTLSVEDNWDSENLTYELTLEQASTAKAEHGEGPTLLIPLAVGLLDASGSELPLRLEGESARSDTTRVLWVTEGRQSFRFIGISERPVPSLLRGFSAPVKLRYGYSDSDLLLLMRSDTDAFNRWEASQQLAVRTIAGMLEDHRHDHALGVDEPLVNAFRDLLEDRAADPALVAEALALPSEAYLAECFQPIEPGAIHEVRRYFRRTLASSLRDVLVHRYRELAEGDRYALDAASMGRRRLRNICLDYLVALNEPETRSLAHRQFQQAHNMTDVLAALDALCQIECPERRSALEAFESRWRHDTLVMDKWFALQAGSSLPRALDDVRRLMRHPVFSIKNPNKVRALIGAYASNSVNFHEKSGRGYRFLAEQILAIDPFNPQVAARLVKAFSRWRLYEPERAALMKAQLERIAAAGTLSKDVYEIVSKSLAEAD